LEDFGNIIFRNLCRSLRLLDNDLFCGRRKLTVSINRTLSYLYYNYYEAIPAAAAGRLPSIEILSLWSSSLVSSFKAYLLPKEFIGLLKPCEPIAL
jgi:hypothetical protein